MEEIRKDEMTLIGHLRNGRFVTEEQAGLLAEEVKKTGESVVQVAIRRGFVLGESLAPLIGLIHNLPPINPEGVEFDPQLRELIPRELAERYSVFPLNVASDGSIRIVTDNYLEKLDIESVFSEKTGKRIRVTFPYNATGVQDLIKRYYQAKPHITHKAVPYALPSQPPTTRVPNIGEIQLGTQSREQPSYQPPPFQLGLKPTQLRARIVEERDYNITNRPALLNGILALLDEGYRINSEDPSELIFTNPRYLAGTPEAERARYEAMKSIVQIDRRITVQMVGDLERMVENALQNPQAKTIREILSNYFAAQDQE